MSIFAVNLAINGLSRVVLFSFLTTQLVVWLIEIRAAGMRSWMRESMKHSYFGYLRRYGGREWKLFASVFAAAFVGFTLIWRLRA